MKLIQNRVSQYANAVLAKHQISAFKWVASQSYTSYIFFYVMNHQVSAFLQQYQFSSIIVEMSSGEYIHRAKKT